MERGGVPVTWSRNLRGLGAAPTPSRSAQVPATVSTTARLIGKYVDTEKCSGNGISGATPAAPAAWRTSSAEPEPVERDASGISSAPGHEGRGLNLFVVRDTRIELVTSSVSGKRSPTELIARDSVVGTAPSWAGGGGDGNRTRVHGFAGRCLTTRPRHHSTRDRDASLRADDGIRTRDPHLGKVMRYQLRHIRIPASLPCGRCSPALKTI